MRAALRSGLKTAFGNTALMAANLGRDVSIARVLGVSSLSDALFLALALPVFVVTTATLGFRSAALPFFERVRHSDGPQVAARCLANVFFWTCLAFVAVSVVVGAGALLLQPMLAAKSPSHATGGSLSLLALCLPMFFVSAAAMLLEGPLQAEGRFLAPALLKISMPVGFAVGMILGAGTDPILYGLVGGQLGAVFQCLATAVLVRRAGLSAAVRPGLSHPQLPAFRQQYGYLLLAGAVTYFNPLVNQWMAAPLGTGAVSTFAYATRLSAGISSLAIGSITPTLLAQFSRSAAQTDRSSLSASYEKACLLMAWISCSGVLFTWLLAAPAVRLLYQGQALSLAQTLEIADFLSLSIVQLVPLSVGICAATMLSATAHNRLLVPIGVLLVSVNVIGNLAFTKVWGLYGLALSTILMYCCSMLVMNTYLLRKGLVAMRTGTIVELLAIVAGFTAVALVAHWAGIAASTIPSLAQLAGIAVLGVIVAGIFWVWARSRLMQPSREH